MHNKNATTSEKSNTSEDSQPEESLHDAGTPPIATSDAASLSNTTSDPVTDIGGPPEWLTQEMNNFETSLKDNAAESNSAIDGGKAPQE